MADRRKFKGRSSVRSGGGGSSLMGLLGGSDVKPVDPSQIDYNDSSFNANTQTRYEAAHPVLNFLSGGAGSTAAANLNNPQILGDNIAKIQQAKALELQDFQNKKMIEQLKLKHGLDSADAFDANEYSKEQENLRSRNKVLSDLGLLPSEQNANTTQLYTAYPATMAARAGFQQKESDSLKKMAENRSADVLRPLQLESDTAAAQANVDNSGALNTARILDTILKPQTTQAEIDLKNNESKRRFSPAGWASVAFDNQTGEVVQPGGSPADRSKAAANGTPITAPPMSLGSPAPSTTTSSGSPISSIISAIVGATPQGNAILRAVESAGRGSAASPAQLLNPTPLNPNPNFSKAMDYNYNTFGIKSNLSSRYSPFGNEDSPVSVPNDGSVTGINAAPTTRAGPSVAPIVTRDAAGNVYINGILQQKKTTNAVPAVAQ